MAAEPEGLSPSVAHNFTARTSSWLLSKFATTKGLKLRLSVEVAPEGGISKQKLEETKAALRELGLSDDLTSR